MSARLPEDLLAQIPADVEGLIFDCDGTLVDTMPVHHRIWCEALAPHGIAFPAHRFYALAGVPTLRIAEMLASEQPETGRCDPRALAEDKDRRYLALGDHGGPIVRVVNIARANKGVRAMAVASGNVTPLVRATLRGAGIDNLFEVVIGADRVAHGKPAPDIFLLAAQEIGVPPAKCLVYEDADLGLEAARAAGMRAVDVRRT